MEIFSFVFFLVSSSVSILGLIFFTVGVLSGNSKDNFFVCFSMIIIAGLFFGWSNQIQSNNGEYAALDELLKKQVSSSVTQFLECGGSVEQFVAPISLVKVEGARDLQICQEGECIDVPKGTHIVSLMSKTATTTVSLLADETFCREGTILKDGFVKLEF